MRRFLVVGCGGSGGATLAFMMDQLRSELLAAGVSKLPDGWQFVLVDVPSGAESGPQGLANVPEQGGTYVGCAPQMGSYALLDGALSQRMVGKGALDTLATWAPRKPDDVHTPISAGAGQYRAIGRMIVLSKAGEIYARLQSAWDRLNRTETITEMATVAAKVPGMGGFDENEPPVVLVVSSMAGGSGASMALDVCRLLTLVIGLDPRLLGVFMVTPDIFDSLPPAALHGVRANSLAMLGEIVAAQTGAAQAHDEQLLQALGQQRGDSEPIPFARVFPVSRFVGSQRMPFGDGSPNAVYRGLARGLAGLMMSGKATDQFVRYDLGNTGSPEADCNPLGWGIANWDVLPWGAFGFASLSMGRDRYAEYAAQRLARSCADKLLTGHQQPGNPATSLEQLDMLVTSQWDALCRAVGVPSAGGVDDQGRRAALGPWIGSSAFPADAVAGRVNAILAQQIRPYLPNPAGLTADQWVPVFRAALNNRRAEVARACANAGYALAFAWHEQFAARLRDQTGRAIAEIGLPYAREWVERLRVHVDDHLAPGVAQLGGMGAGDVLKVDERVDAALRSMRGQMTNPEQILDLALDGFRTNVQRQVFADAAARVGEVMQVMGGELLTPLRDALSQAMAVLEQAQKQPPTDVGLARLTTDVYTAWPSDGDELVPGRFAEANNEVLLTSSSAFKERYELIDLPRAVAGSDATIPLRTAVQGATTDVISGLWKTAGQSAPGGLITEGAVWSTRALGTDPNDGRSRVPTRALFDVHTRPAELLSRARLFVGRPGESFADFCRVSLRDYVQGVGAAESELAARRADIVAKFREATTLARPLISVNHTAVVRLHGRDEQYRYKFSEIPFAGKPVAGDLADVLRREPLIDQATRDNFDQSLSDEGSVTRIDIFGSYQNYSPLVYDSVLSPAASQWVQTAEPGRAGFWKWRRARPLPASLPVTETDRRTMTAGWFLGQLTGHIQIPASPYRDAVRIFDSKAGQWLSFPNPLLTPPSAFHATYDWLPAVLESMLLAIAQSSEPPVMRSLLPYQTLRALYDDNSQGPAGGILERSGDAVARAFLRTGALAGSGSRVPAVAVASTPAERLVAAVDWLQGIATVARKYLPSSHPAADPAGAFTIVANRAQAGKTPIFRDLAPDVYWATGELTTLLQRQASALESDPGGSSAPGDEGPDVEIPEGGTF